MKIPQKNSRNGVTQSTSLGKCIFGAYWNVNVFPSIENFCCFHSQYSLCLLKHWWTVLLKLTLVWGIQCLTVSGFLALSVKQIGLQLCLSRDLALPVSIGVFIVWSNVAKEKIFLTFWKLKDYSCSEKKQLLWCLFLHHGTFSMSSKLFTRNLRMLNWWEWKRSCSRPNNKWAQSVVF